MDKSHVSFTNESLSCIEGDEYNSKTNKNYSTRNCTQRNEAVRREISQSRKSNRHNSSSNQHYDLVSTSTY